MDLATQRLLFKEVDPKGRPPPVAYETNAPTDGGWAAVTSVAGQGHKISVRQFSNPLVDSLSSVHSIND